MKKKESGFDWWDSNVTSEIYLNTHRADWWKACEILGAQIKGAKSLIDIGGGDAHTLWQVLSVASQKGANFRKITFVEPSAVALRRASERLKGFSTRLILYKGSLEKLAPKLLSDTSMPYDVLYAGHVNYYFGKESRGTQNLVRYGNALKLLPKLARRVIIMTAPKSSDYYKVVESNPFSENVYSEVVADLYRSEGYKVDIVKMPLRFYIAHAFVSEHEAVILWNFFNDTTRKPSKKDVSAFLKRLETVMDKQGYMNFKDELVIVTKKL